jgi:hypothetical protein
MEMNAGFRNVLKGEKQLLTGDIVVTIKVQKPVFIKKVAIRYLLNYTQQK